MSSKFKFVTLFVAMLALVIQPMYGFVADQVANATPVNGHVVLNEFSFGTDKWVELYNPTSSAVSTQDWGIAVNGSREQNINWSGPTKTVPAGGITLFAIPPFASIDFSGKTIQLIDGANNTIDTVTFPSISITSSYARLSDGDSNFEARAGSNITKGTTNTIAPIAPVCTYDFAAQKMWEVTWGYDFAHRNGGAPKFTMQSNGGLTSLNGGPVPSYMSASWHWLYITEGQTTRHYDYGFADGTVRTADITFSNVNGCQVPEITWGVNTSSTTFVNDPKYVRENNATDLAAQLVTPDSTTDVRFFVDGNVSVPIMGSNVGGAGATTSWWRLYAPLTAGKHTISAQVEVSGQWYPVVDTGIVYSLDTPTATYVSPNDTSFTFRPSDNPIRVKASDQFNQFKSMDVKIGATTYTVLREDCDLRAAGNYVLCDVNASSTWSSLAEGTYTAVTSVKTQANNRLDGLTSRQFTVDGIAPQMMNARIVSPTNTPVYKDSIVLAQYVKESNQLNGVKFYVTKQRPDGQCDPNSPKVLATQSAHFVNHNPTNDTWYYSTTVDTSSLNGTNCIFSVAEDAAMNHSDPQVKKISANFDNTAPSVPTAILKDANDKIITNGYINTENFKFNLSTPATDNSIKYQVKYWNDIAGDQFQGESKAWTTNADVSGVYGDHFTRGEGTHYFAFSACDAVGNCSAYSTPLEVVYDNTAPAKPTITSPGERTWHKTSPIATTWAAATDINGIKNYQVAYSYDDDHGFAGSTCPGIAIAGKDVYCRDESATHRNHNPGSGEEGGVTVWVRAIDVAGNEGAWSKSVHYYYDHTNPTTTLVVPTGVVGNNFTISGVADDNLALNRVYIQLNKREGGRFGGTTINLITNPFSTTNDWSKTFDANVLGLTDGDYRATASVTDMAGNTTQLDWSDYFTVDTAAPDGSFTYSNNKAPTKGNVYAYLTTTEPVTISPSGSHGWEAIDATHFKHKFTNNGSFNAVITDEAGNSSTLTATVNWIDRTAPSVTHYAYSNAGLTKNNVTVTITTSESVDTPTDWTYVDDTHFTRVFEHNGGFTVSLTDKVGNTATVGGKQQGAEVKRIDKNAPVISGITEGETVSGAVHLSVFDPKYEGYDGFDVNGLNVDGHSVATTPGANKTYLYDVTTEGSHTVFATDKAGNVSTTLHFTIDNTAPALSVQSYSGTDTKPVIKGTTGSASDVVTVDGSTNGVTISTTPNADGTYDWTYTPANPFKVGKTTLTIRSADQVGNYTEDETIVTVTSKKKPSTLSRTAVDNGDNSFTPAAPVVTIIPAAVQTTGQAVAAQDVKASETTESNSEKKDVKGLETTADTATSAGTKDGWNLFGLAWYWWLVLLAVIVSFWWIIAAKKRRADSNA